MTTVRTFEEDRAKILSSFEDFKSSPNPHPTIVVTTAEESAPSYFEKLLQPKPPTK
jgi:hypothetical protein